MSNSKLNELTVKAYDFFFRPQSAVKAALFRVSFGTIAFLSELLNLSHLTQYYTNNGYFSNQMIGHIEGLAHFSPLAYISSAGIVIALYWLLIITTIFFTLGFYSRLCAAVVFLLMLCFIQRDVLLQYGGDRIMRDGFLFCIFIPLDSCFSLTNYLFKRPNRNLVPGWSIRLLQIQVALMYFFTAVLKVSNPQWRQGTYLFSLLNNPNFALFHIPWVKNFALPLAIMTFGVLLLELSFIFLVWWRRTNLLIIAAISLEHVGILLTMNATYFSEIMLALLILCVDDLYVSRFTAYLKRRFPRLFARSWLPALLQ